MQESIVQILLFISTLVSAGAGIIVFESQQGIKANRYLSLVLICGSMWCFSILLTLLTGNLFVSNLSFFASGLMFAFINLYILSFVGLLSRQTAYLIFAPAAIISVFSLIDGFLVKQINIQNGYIKVIEYGPFYWLYLIFLAAYLLLLFFSLYKAFKKSLGIQRLQILYLIIGIFLASIFGLLFNLVFPAFGVFKFNSLGPVFILFVSTAAAYAATRHYIYDRQVVFSELWAFFLVLLGIVWLVSNTTLFNFILFILIVSISIMLIRSVVSEADKKIALQKDKQELERADKLKDEFIQMAQHELNTPIGIIEGRLSMIIDENMGGFNEKQREYLKPVYTDARRLANLTKALVEVSEIDQNTVKLIPEKFDLVEVINIELTTLSALTKNKGLTLEADMPNRLILTKADKKKIKKTLNVLITNAVKFTTHGGVKIKVFEVDAMAQVTISDTGIGIEKVDLPRVFEKFFQSNRFDKSGPLEQQGTGLSLYIIKHWIELHNGKITVASQKNIGTTFTFSLPV